MTAMGRTSRHVVWFEDLGASDTDRVGGKNASLGEMTRALKDRGVRVPEGFATTADAYRAFLAHNDLDDKLRGRLADLDDESLAGVGEDVRRMLLDGEVPPDVAEEVRTAYGDLSARYEVEAVDVAVRSSATAEDLPDASFAGQQESFLNVTGEGQVLDAIKRCYASLFTDRAIAYREEKGFDQLAVALSVGVQKMVRSDKAGAGVLFTIDTEHGFRDVVVLTAAWGLGEMVVQGRVDPDEYVVFKPLLGQEGLVPVVGRTRGDKRVKLVYADDDDGEAPTREVDVPDDDRRAPVLDDGEVLQLARWGCQIEDHYGRPMDVEWAKDGGSGDLFVVQARPETVQSRKGAASLTTYRLVEEGTTLVRGLAVGDGIAAGKVFALEGPDDFARFQDGGVIVTEMTDPDWVPVMRRAAAVVTDHGGRTAHAAIVSRELGLPAVVGAGEATEILKDGQEVTVSCAQGDEGLVYEGTLDFEVEETPLDDVPRTTTKIMINLAEPSAAFRWWRLPADGVGLARMEFIVSNAIKVHPLALTRFDELEDEDARRQVEQLVEGTSGREEYFVDRLAQGIARIAATHHPNPVILRTSDFKTNEYADLVGGRQFEPREANPMLGWRGASRYYSDDYRDGFALECAAIRRVREEIGLANVMVMIPFCRTPEEADRVLQTLADEGLVRGRGGLEVYVMCEVPSNVILAEEFAARFDGFSIGSNDLTQLVLGVDRDSSALAHLFDETHEAVTRAVRDLIERAHGAGVKIGICGEAPSNHPEFAATLVEAGIDSMSVSPDRLLAVKGTVAAAEARRSGSDR